jgi:wyosine [tRNA(Phe)-imidazoG37] synthetase (radical SAM superfamily)
MRTLYGLIDSWRFGRSFGIDPLAQKTKLCPFSCIYCQYGPTAQPTLQRQSYVSPERLENDLRDWGPIDCDQITFAGLGEPTLARNLAQLVEVVHRHTSKPIAILTGSALLPHADVRRDLMHFDHIVVKLDAPNQKLFQQINRPQHRFPYAWAALVEGIRLLRQTYTGRLGLQIMFLQANAGSAPQMAELARTLKVDEIHLDTPLQPALGGPVSATQMDRIERAFADLPAQVVIQNIYRKGQAQTKPRFL